MNVPAGFSQFASFVLGAASMYWVLKYHLKKF